MATSINFSGSPLILILAGHFLIGTSFIAQGASQDKIKSEQAAFTKNVKKAIGFLEKGIKRRTVAVLDVRAELDSDANSTAAKNYQKVLQSVLSFEGVTAVFAEATRKITVKRNKRKLPGGLLFKKEDALYFLKEIKADLVLVPRLAVTKNQYTLKLNLLELKTLRSLYRFSLPAVRIQDVPLETLCAVELIPPLNQKILQFATANLGKKVDRGECWDVPAHVMKAEGYRVQGYTFGKKISWAEALPGDVLTTKTHVMVLEKAAKNPSRARILHQNVNGKRFIVKGYLGKQADHITIWRPGRISGGVGRKGRR